MAGRPRILKMTIVDPGDILVVQVIRNATWCLPILCQAVQCRGLQRDASSKTTCIAILAMFLVQVYNQSVDSKRWACQDCAFRKSIRTGSFLREAIYL